jgi:hypothetical protein
MLGPRRLHKAREHIVSKVAVVLDDKDLNELKVILLDNDSEEALRFLKKVIWERAEAARRQGMRSHLEKGQQ